MRVRLNLKQMSHHFREIIVLTLLKRLMEVCKGSSIFFSLERNTEVICLTYLTLSMSSKLESVCKSSKCV